MRDRHGLARYLAPAAFLLAFTIAVLLVRAGLNDDEDAAPPATTVATATTTTAPARTKRTPTRPRGTATTTAAAEFYEVEPGDTLDQIALEHDTSVARLLELNPGVETTSLQVGQRIRVK